MWQASMGRRIARWPRACFSLETATVEGMLQLFDRIVPEAVTFFVVTSDAQLMALSRDRMRHTVTVFEIGRVVARRCSSRLCYSGRNAIGRCPRPRRRPLDELPIRLM